MNTVINANMIIRLFFADSVIFCETTHHKTGTSPLLPNRREEKESKRKVTTTCMKGHLWCAFSLDAPVLRLLLFRQNTFSTNPWIITQIRILSASVTEGRRMREEVGDHNSISHSRWIEEGTEDGQVNVGLAWITARKGADGLFRYPLHPCHHCYSHGLSGKSSRLLVCSVRREGVVW